MLSVIVRSHNDAEYIGRTLTALTAQTLSAEILVCDDASADDTPAIAAKFANVRILPRPAGEYRPGKTLNHCLRYCRGDIVVFNNADAVPLNANYLEKLTAPLRDAFDAEIAAAAVYGAQCPRCDALGTVRLDHMRAFGDGKIAAGWQFFFSLASAAARRSDLLAQPFNEELKYSEDVEWARRTAARGGRIIYAAEAAVEHSHNYTLGELVRRFYGEGRADAQMGLPRPGVLATVRRTAAAMLRDWFYLAPRPAVWSEIPTSPLRRAVQNLAYFQGTRNA